MSVLAIDFGTSRIKAAYWDEESGKAVVLPLGKGGRLYVPSLFHLSKDGKIRFGDEAEVMLHHDPQGVVENLKLDLDKPIKYVPNGQQVKSAELMSLLFRRIIDYAIRLVPAFGGSAPKTLVLTLPSRWDYSDIYMDALETIGYTGEKVVIREPEAAGLAWVEEQKPKPDDMLVVLDFGGGTIDWACLCVDEKGHPQMIAELPPGGITAAGSHVDAGLLDEMMNRINDDQRREVQHRRAQVLEQIRQLKESQNGTATLSGEDGLLEVQLGAESFVYPKKLFEEVVRREVIDQAVEGIGGYLRRVARTVKSGSADRQIWCVMAGGTRLLSGLEERVKEQLFDIGKSSGVAMNLAAIAQADFATVRGAVLRAAPERNKPVNNQLKIIAQMGNESDVNSEIGQISFLNRFEYDAQYIKIAGGRYIYSVTEAREMVDDLYFAKYLVTNKQYRLFITYLDSSVPELEVVVPLLTFKNALIDIAMSHQWNVKFVKNLAGNNLAERFCSTYDINERFNGDNQPVVGVTWYAARAYCLWLSMLEGEIKRYRLPTEVEWEWAAGGMRDELHTAQKVRRFPWSETGQPSKLLANFTSSKGCTTPVGSYPKGATKEGLCDMAGNVWEWMETTYNENVTRAALRGGSWSSFSEMLHCSSRMECAMVTTGRRDIGFRVVCDDLNF